MEMGNKQHVQKNNSYNGFQTKGGNLIWAGALSLAWHQLVDNIIKQPITITSKDPQINKIVQNFNKCSFTRKDIDERCIYVKSGYGQKTVDQINFECKKKFPQKSFGDIKAQLSPLDIISYAYLLKKLEFTKKFDKNTQNNFIFQGKNIPSFYAKNEDQKKQIRYFNYKSQDEFLISIDAKNPNDQIFFIKDNKVKSIDEAIQKVMNQQGKQGQIVEKKDFFEMPIVDLDVKRNVKEVEGQVVTNKKFSDYVFAVVYEAVKLKIDESGAKVENQGVIMMLKCCIMPKQEEPKRFILDKQFWVVMKEKGKHPYFCALIKNPEDK